MYAIEKLKQKIILMITKALITAVNDTNAIQVVQVNMGNEESIDSVERIQNFGLTSSPVVGTECIVLCIAGDREHPIVIASDSSEHRPKLDEGETALYNAHNMIVKLKDGKIEMGIDTFKKLVNENFQSINNNHVHEYLRHPTASVAAKSTKPIDPLGVLPVIVTTLTGIPKGITSNELTSKVEAE